MNSAIWYQLVQSQVSDVEIAIETFHFFVSCLHDWTLRASTIYFFIVPLAFGFSTKRAYPTSTRHLLSIHTPPLSYPSILFIILFSYLAFTQFYCSWRMEKKKYGWAILLNRGELISVCVERMIFCSILLSSFTSIYHGLLRMFLWITFNVYLVLYVSCFNIHNKSDDLSPSLIITFVILCWSFTMHLCRWIYFQREVGTREYPMAYIIFISSLKFLSSSIQTSHQLSKKFLDCAPWWVSGHVQPVLHRPPTVELMTLAHGKRKDKETGRRM